MNKKYFLLILIIFSFTVNSALSADYYPELGLDPFYSSLNPTYIDEEEMPENQESIVNIIKNKRQERKERKLQKKIEKEKKDTSSLKELSVDNADKINELPAVNDKIDREKQEQNIIEAAEDTFISKQKTGLTKAELEKELREEERQKQKELEKLNQKEEKVSLKDRLFLFNKKKKEKKEEEQKVDPSIELTADYMEYFPDRYEVEAVGNSQVIFKSQNLKLTANKIVFNYDRNILKASENVVLTTPESTTEGDFVRIDLSKPSGFVENPVTSMEDIQLSAKEAFLYSDRIEENDGVAKILKDEVLSLGARSFASYVDQGRVFQQKPSLMSNEAKGVYKLKANTIIIDSKDDHEVITIKNADLYLKNHKIAKVPSVKIITNKTHTSVESNFPEIGSQSMLGSHIGPAVVLNVPGGSTLKLAPILTYKDDKLGFGGIARFRNQYNMTEVAYGTSKDELVIRGRHKLAPGLLLNYSRYANQNEWFLGYRMPKYGGQLSYSRTDYVKDLKLRFSQMYSAGVFVDKRKNVDWGDAEGRFRWMTQTFKSLYQYKNDEGNISLNVGLVAQTAASVYTSGDTAGLFRIGPALNTKVGPWTQALMYYQTATAGSTPFDFDRYRYGRSNVVLIESLKVCKYLTLGYMASLAMNSDYKNDDLFQENRILVSIGPEYARLTVGYDSMRRNTMFILSMLVGTKDSDIKFKKAVLKNPDKFGKEKSKQKKSKKKSYKKYLKETV
ncbi:TPA: LPS-assembly protein LptD [Candidatus Avigastranaerophilus faecigallinarum]|nr:LPS-assembly protein LptD [Candidatus Avigastranaerophilus faecigallinarum]